MEVLQTRTPGDAIRIEATVKETSAFSDTETKIDADTITITIENPSGTEVISDIDMTKNATGEYYYIWQTSISDTEGDYKVIVVSTKDGYQEVTVEYIRLKEFSL